MVKQPDITEYLQAGLKGLGLRQSVIANNIANLHTAGYRRSTVPFEERLAEAIAAGTGIDVNELREAVIQPKNTPVGPSGNDVDLETEIGELVKNVAMYKTYLRLMAKLRGQMELAMRS